MVFKNGIGNGNKNHTTQISLLPTVISLLISLLSSLLRSLLPTQILLLPARLLFYLPGFFLLPAQILLLPAQFHCYR